MCGSLLVLIFYSVGIMKLFLKKNVFFFNFFVLKLLSTLIMIDQVMVFSLKNNNRCTNILLIIFRCKCFTICVCVVLALLSV